MANPLLSEVSFGSYLVYSPRGTSELSRKSRRMRDAIKRGDEAALRALVAHLARNFATSRLAAVLGPNVTLVPAPRSSPLVEGALWPPRLIAGELVAAGLGREVRLLLERVEAVPKSSFQKPGERPSARRHYETIQAHAELLTTPRLTLVDDFVTKGNTLLGGASRLAETFPAMRLAAFALVRTRGLQPDVADLVEPCVGRVVRVGDDWAEREP